MRAFIFSAAALCGSVRAASFDDCGATLPDLFVRGPYSPAFFNATDQEGVEIFGLVPAETPPEGGFPVLAYAHGLGSTWAMTEESLNHFSSHGFAVVFPHILGPDEDSRPFTTDPMGDFLLKGIEYAQLMAEDSSSPLYGKIDVTKFVIGGHSMGGSTTIMAGARLKTARQADIIKFAFSLHPGLCGPIGPPPCLVHGGPLCSTWLDIDLDLVAQSIPFLFTTATNDSAFRPAPNTAEFSYDCFQGGLEYGDAARTTPAVFTEFSEEACDGGPLEGGGHNCPLKVPDAGAPQWPWILSASKLYAHQGGLETSNCHELFLGNGEGSMRNSPDLFRSDFRDVE